MYYQVTVLLAVCIYSFRSKIVPAYVKYFYCRHFDEGLKFLSYFVLFFYNFFEFTPAIISKNSTMRYRYIQILRNGMTTFFLPARMDAIQSLPPPPPPRTRHSPYCYH
jgi:hypothetical protein